MTRVTFRDQVAAYFTAAPGRWIPATELARVGGRQAWRTRVSECRKLGMVIEHRLQRVQHPSGEWSTLSEYRYVPPAAEAKLGLIELGWFGELPIEDR